jgi:hypothetical protein
MSKKRSREIISLQWEAMQSVIFGMTKNEFDRMKELVQQATEERAKNEELMKLRRARDKLLAIPGIEPYAEVMDSITVIREKDSNSHLFLCGYLKEDGWMLRLGSSTIEIDLNEHFMARPHYHAQYTYSEIKGFEVVRVYEGVCPITGPCDAIKQLVDFAVFLIKARWPKKKE